MGWQLAADVTFCIASGDVIFLDVMRDRYFQLAPRHNNAFIASLRQAAILPLNLSNFLVERGLIEPLEGPDRWVPISAPIASRDLETFDTGVVATLIDTPAIVANFRRARGRLRRDGLAAALVELSGGRGTTETAEMLAARFCATARRLGQDANCLIRSLALRHYLHRRQVSATLIFGVTSRPFRAHCWLQRGDVILNDQLDHVAPFIPILVR